MSEMKQHKAPRIDQWSYEFPLANGESARLYVPKGITKSDIKRLSHMLTAIVLEQEVAEIVEYEEQDYQNIKELNQKEFGCEHEIGTFGPACSICKKHIAPSEANPDAIQEGLK